MSVSVSVSLTSAAQQPVRACVRERVVSVGLGECASGSGSVGECECESAWPGSQRPPSLCPTYVTPTPLAVNSLSLSVSVSLSVSLALSHTHTHTHSLTLALSLSRALSHSHKDLSPAKTLSS